MDLAETIYQVVNNFPKEEKFGLSSQLKRCAVSVPLIFQKVLVVVATNSLNSLLKFQWAPATKFKHNWNLLSGSAT